MSLLSTSSLVGKDPTGTFNEHVVSLNNKLYLKLFLFVSCVVLYGYRSLINSFFSSSSDIGINTDTLEFETP